MNNNQLLTYLKSLSKTELQQFRDFVYSPYFNKHLKTQELFYGHLKTKNWRSAIFEKEKVYSKLFPGQSYDDQELSNVISYLLRLLKKFLAFQTWQEQEEQVNLKLLEAAFEREENRVFTIQSKNWQNSKKLLNKGIAILPCNNFNIIS